MENLALLLKAIDMAKLMKDGMILLNILVEASPIITDAISKITVIVNKHLADSGVTPEDAATLFKGLLNGLLASHVNTNSEKPNEVK
jgi:predicted alpha-1,6-mannanase (GH76 family)